MKNAEIIPTFESYQLPFRFFGRAFYLREKKSILIFLDLCAKKFFHQTFFYFFLKIIANLISILGIQVVIICTVFIHETNKKNICYEDCTGCTFI
jgi:hypothetical protein